MLQITPDSLIYLRMVQASTDGKMRIQKRLADDAKVKVRQLNKDKFKQLVSTVADAMKQGEPTKFAFEGACRHGVRSSLCLQGWPWRDADAAAASVVSSAFNCIGAQRPTWQQGQPEWTEEGFAPVQRTRCINCYGKLPEDSEAKRFCSPHCGTVYHSRIAKQFDLKQSRVEWLARVAAETKHREAQRELSCDCCGKNFIRALTKPNQRFCSPACVHEASKTERRKLVDRACIQCGTMFRPKSEQSKYCGQRCVGKAISEAMRRPPIKCRVCSKKFRAAIPSRKFCSIECRAVGLREIADKPCAYCKTMFRPSHAAGLYCSKVCSGAANRKVRPELTCETCKSIFRATYASEVRRFCSPPCANEANRGFGRYLCTPISRR